MKKLNLDDFESIMSFFICQYCLNLFSSAFHYYFPHVQIQWLRSQERYLDLRGCVAHSFGKGRPIDLIYGLSEYNIEISDEELITFTDHFFQLLEAFPRFDITSKQLASKLVIDNDCSELHPYLANYLNK